MILVQIAHNYRKLEMLKNQWINTYKIGWRGIMDNFIDKLAQKFSAQEVIKANLAAEAKETRRLREKMESYETLLTEMRQINLKNMESAEKVKQLMQEGIAGDKDYFQEQFDKLNETLHTENVKVYRNVQAAINESLEGQTKQLLEEQQKLIEEQHQLLEQTKVFETLNISNKKGFNFLKVMSVLILVGVIADVVFAVMNMLNFKFF